MRHGANRDVLARVGLSASGKNGGSLTGGEISYMRKISSRSRCTRQYLYPSRVVHESDSRVPLEMAVMDTAGSNCSPEMCSVDEAEACSKVGSFYPQCFSAEQSSRMLRPCTVSFRLIERSMATRLTWRCERVHMYRLSVCPATTPTALHSKA